MRIVITFFIALMFLSCKQPSSENTAIITHVRDTIYDQPSIDSIDFHSLYYTLEDSTSYKYCCEERKLVTQWIQGLPEKLRHDLIMQKLVVEKIYYLSDILLDNEDKIEAILEYDRILATQLYSQIGMYQGIPSVVLATRIIPSEETTYKKQEGILLKLNKFAH